MGFSKHCCLRAIFTWTTLAVLTVLTSACGREPAPTPTAIATLSFAPRATAMAVATPAVPPASAMFFDPAGGGQESGNIDLYAVEAPEFPPDTEWLNTDRPLSLAQLRGKVVLLDFWTYGCINCLHNFPELKRLQAAYPDELVIIGIHSAKFAHESETENIRQVILRYDLEYPVINDDDLHLWNEWNAQAWPTSVLIDPAGNVADVHLGEGVYSAFNALVRRLVNAAASRGKLDRTPLRLKLEKSGLPATVLSFPGKVLADPASTRLFIADTNHNRIIIADAGTGDVLNVIGDGQHGLRDGAFRQASFAAPQGMALSANGASLYVADTGNHAIRGVDLAGEQVTTLAGTGAKLFDFPPQGGVAPEVTLSSPWDLALAGETLYIAMAGVHQLWAFDLLSGAIGPLVGNGHEGTRDGSLTQAELAQPSGLALGIGGELFFADTEASSIRRATPGAAGEVATLAGSGRTLFDFGDVDGIGNAVRLQHPAGLAYDADVLYVADTYNNKIKQLDLTTNRVTTMLGGAAGWRDGADPLFYEPGGISVAHGKLYVADTNNHAVRVVDLATRTTSTLVLKGIQQFTAPADDAAFTGKLVELPPLTVGAGPGVVWLDVTLPAGYKLNELAPQSIAWHTDGDIVTWPDAANRTFTNPQLPIPTNVTFRRGDGILRGDITLIYCAVESASLCLIDQVQLVAPVTVAASGAKDAKLAYEVLLGQ